MHRDQRYWLLAIEAATAHIVKNILTTATAGAGFAWMAFSEKPKQDNNNNTTGQSTGGRKTKKSSKT